MEFMSWDNKKKAWKIGYTLDRHWRLEDQRKTVRNLSKKLVQNDVFWSTTQLTYIQNNNYSGRPEPNSFGCPKTNYFGQRQIRVLTVSALKCHA